MAKANQTYHKRDLYSEVTARIGAMTLARYYAKQAVKAQWQAQGLKLQNIEASGLSRQANAYLDQHLAELIALATERYRSFVESGRLQRQRS